MIRHRQQHNKEDITMTLASLNRQNQGGIALYHCLVRTEALTLSFVVVVVVVAPWNGDLKIAEIINETQASLQGHLRPCVFTLVVSRCQKCDRDQRQVKTGLPLLSQNQQSTKKKTTRGRYRTCQGYESGRSRGA